MFSQVSVVQVPYTSVNSIYYLYLFSRLQEAYLSCDIMLQFPNESVLKATKFTIPIGASLFHAP